MKPEHIRLLAEIEVEIKSKEAAKSKGLIGDRGLRRLKSLRESKAIILKSYPNSVRKGYARGHLKVS